MAATGRILGNRRKGISDIMASASRLELWLPASTAGPSPGNCSRCRTVRPSAIRITARTTTAKNRNRSSLTNGFLLMDKEIADEVDEDRRRVSEAIDAVEDAAMTGDQPAGVLDAEIALHRRHSDFAEKARDA